MTDRGTEATGPAQNERAALGEFLRVVVPLAAMFGLVQGVVALWLRDTSMLLLALLIAVYGACLLVAKVLFDRGRPRASVVWISAGLTGPTVAGVWLQSAMLPVASLVPLMALAAALPFVPPRRMGIVLVAIGAWEVAIGLTAALAPIARDPAPWYRETFTISTTACAAIVTALLWMRYRSRLVQARDREREISERLREVDRLKTTLLRAASHDLRTPTAAILGAARTLERVDLDSADARALLGTISGGAGRLASLLDDLLDAERLHLGTVELTAEPNDLASVVTDTLPTLELRDHRVVVDLRPAPAALDARKAGRVVENLVANAIKHAGPGATVWVRVHVGPEGPELVVEDDGPGVPVGERDLIFAPFQRGATPATGTGLGLSIVAGFVELHGGRVWIEDRPGGGASFHATFPRSAAAAAASDVGGDAVTIERTG